MIQKALFKISNRPILSAFVISFATLFILYPRLFLGLDYVMGQGVWELQDPAVSSLVFVPAGRMLRHELFANGFNFLWSNTRGYGQPILGNDIQGAPLFPLTVLFRGLPDPYFWQFFVLVRLILLGGFSFLFAREVLNRSKAGAFTFMLCFGFAVHVVRWNNHAWQSGLLATVMYLYFSSKVILEHPRFSLKLSLGLVLSVYCILTSGFPESNILGAFLSLFILAPLLIKQLFQVPSRAKLLGLLVFLNAVGFFLGSPQVLGIYEIVHTATQKVTFRTGPGVVQFHSLDILWRMITRITEGPPKGEAIHFFNLIPLFLMGLGLIQVISKRLFDWKFWAALFCFVFYLLKNFPVWPWFNQFIGQLPLLSTVWFLVYFLPLFIFPLAYLASLGAERLLETSPSRKQIAINFVLAVAVIGCLLTATGLEPSFSPTRIARLLTVFLVFWAFLHLNPSKIERKLWVSGSLVVFLILELSTVRPIHFMKYSDGDYKRQFSHERSAAVGRLLEAHNLNPIELRDRSAGGEYAELGVTSMNNGSAPVIPPRPNRLINLLFKTWDGWGAAMPVLGQKVPHAYRLVSHNLQIYQSENPNEGFVDDREWTLLGKAFDSFVFYDPKALPRAYLASFCRPVSDMGAASEILSDPSKFALGTAVIEGLGPEEVAFCETLNRASIEKVSLTQDRGKTVSLTKVRGPGVLVLNDSFYTDWKVTDKVSGLELSIKPTNINFRGVLLKEARDYELTFEYIPRWLALAKILIGLGLAALAGLIGFSLLSVGPFAKNIRVYERFARNR